MALTVFIVLCQPLGEEVSVHCVKSTRELADRELSILREEDPDTEYWLEVTPVEEQ